MLRALIAAAAAVLTAACATTPAGSSTAHHVIPGSFVADRGPDGNSIFLDAPDGLILVDTGRHPAHRDLLLNYARERGLPIVAILNTHWHLDHATGNGDIRAAYPQAQLYTTNAIDGALANFLRQGRERQQARLDAGQVPPERMAEVRRFLDVMAHPETLRPTRPVVRDEVVTIGGRRLELNVAPFAATEADLWIRDPAAGLVIVGDLVVTEVPFMDTACAEGWRRALDRLAETPFTILIPGHGDPMDRAAFLVWRTAFNNLLDCAASSAERAACIAGWRRDAARFMIAGREAMIDDYVGYYIDSRLRAAPEEQQRFCRPQPTS